MPAGVGRPRAAVVPDRDRVRHEPDGAEQFDERADPHDAVIAECEPECDERRPR